MITMKVLGLTLDATSNTPILVLQREDGEEVLPIWIGAAEAMAISMAINQMQLDRPLTHSLLLQTVTALGGQMTGVSITALQDGTFFAFIELVHNHEFIHVDCRPSDGIALALRAQAPILIAPDVLQKAAQDRVSPTSSEADKRPSDIGDALIRRVASEIPSQVHGHTAGRSGAVQHAHNMGNAPFLTGTLSVGSLTDEKHLAELLRTLEPASKRVM